MFFFSFTQLLSCNINFTTKSVSYIDVTRPRAQNMRAKYALSLAIAASHRAAKPRVVPPRCPSGGAASLRLRSPNYVSRLWRPSPGGTSLAAPKPRVVPPRCPNYASHRASYFVVIVECLSIFHSIDILPFKCIFQIKYNLNKLIELSRNYVEHEYNHQLLQYCFQIYSAERQLPSQNMIHMFQLYSPTTCV